MKNFIKKANFNFIIDAMAFVVFVLLMSTGILIRYILPPGFGHFGELWGMDRHVWGYIHFWIAILFIVFIVLHIFLHWKWIAQMIEGNGQGNIIRIAIAVVGFIILIGLAVVPFFGKVDEKGEPPHKVKSVEPTESHDYNINGSMTLKDVEHFTGVSCEDILRELAFPGNFPVDERLGKLRKDYGFELNDIREIIKKHTKK